MFTPRIVDASALFASLTEPPPADPCVTRELDTLRRTEFEPSAHRLAMALGAAVNEIRFLTDLADVMGHAIATGKVDPACALTPQPVNYAALDRQVVDLLRACIAAGVVQADNPFLRDLNL